MLNVPIIHYSGVCDLSEKLMKYSVSRADDSSEVLHGDATDGQQFVV